MGLLDWGADPDPEDDDDEPDRTIDFFRVLFQPSDAPGWRIVEGFEELESPISEDDFKFSEDPLDDGKYRLAGIDTNGRITKPPEDVGWQINNKSTGGHRDRNKASGASSDDVQALRRQIRTLEQRLESGTGDPGAQMERIRATLLEAAASNPAFMDRYGEKVYDWVLDVDHGKDAEGPSYEQWKDSPFSAIAYDFSQTMMHDPSKMRQLGENMGGGMGAFLDGIASSAIEAPSEPTEAAQESQQGAPGRMAGVQGGPTTLGDLGESEASEADSLTDELTGALMDRRRAEDAQREAAEAAVEAGAVQDDAADAVQDDAVQDDDDGLGLDPDRCQHIKADNKQCGNEPVEGSDYCWVEGHGPPTDDAGGAADRADASIETNGTTDDDVEDAPATAPDGEPSEQEVADAL